MARIITGFDDHYALAMPIDSTTDAEPIDSRWIWVVAIADWAASAWRE